MSGDSAQTARATLELDLKQGPPRGELTAVGGRRWQFSGWIALASALEAWRDGTSAAPSAPGDGTADAGLAPDGLAESQEVGE